MGNRSRGRVYSKRINELVKKLEAYEPEQVFLFGSWARGEADEVSDIDLIIIKPTDEDFFDRIRTVMRLLNHPGAVDVLVYTPEEFKRMRKAGNAFIEMILEEGVLLYGKAG